MQVIPRWTDSYIQGDERLAIEKRIEEVFHDEQFTALFIEKVEGPVIVHCSCDVPSSTIYAVASDSDGRKVATLKIELDTAQTFFNALV